ncbi:orexin receptor type 2 isoform X1 [Patella vulgata]|uniref:orexin receptor type 2 isoform X1 n=1 Tax=Patella vulgata TaxID=6465 RepID=UPI00217F89B1|nr:orexin receptor type 2 isoform X1 [Patella vulgata]XP_050402928.1 orexin receptor type 2 isoform X1 [Patella vulgata]
MAAYSVINSSGNSSTLTNLTEIRKCKYAEGEQCYYSDEHLMWSINKHLEPEPHEWIFCVLFIIVFIFGVTGNSLVCFAVWRNVQLRTITNFFLVNLAVADLLVIVICLPPTFAQTFWETWFLGDAMCKIVEFLQNISVIVSVLTLTAISIERWFAICHPLSFKETRRHVIITLIVIWVAANVFSVPSLIIFSTVPDAMVPDNLTVLLTTCRPSGYEQTTLYKEIIHLVVFYVIPVIVMTFAYFSIASCLWSSIKKGKALTEGMQGMQDKVSHQLRSRRRAAKMLIVVVIVFILCYLPVYIWNILRMTNLDLINRIPDKKVSGIGYTAHLLIYLNSSINPVIYNFMSGKFRKEFQTAFFCCFRRRRTERGHYGSHELEPFPNKSGASHADGNNSRITAAKCVLTDGTEMTYCTSDV